MHLFTLDGASDGYRAAREELRRAEIELKDRREKVAALRRRLPRDAPVPEDYVFGVAADGGTVRLSQLFEADKDALLVIHFMWASDDDTPCPMCTMWADGYNAVMAHVAQKAPAVVVAKQDAGTIQAFAEKRGWRDLRIVSSGGNTFNRDFGMEDEAGHQLPGVSVFVRGNDAAPRHFYTVSALMGDDHYRGMDLYSPVWNLFDLLPEGRGDWMPRLSYEVAEAP